MKTRLKPVYFENQRQAASLLGLDEYDLKEWKADGCPAFKYGRIYHAELLEWIEAKAQKANPSDGAKGRRFAIGELMFALAKAYEADAITHEQYFEQTTALVTALGEKEVTTEWIQNQFDWLSENFPNIADAWKAHPKVMQWLHDLAGFRGQRKRLKLALRLTRPDRRNDRRNI